jgi:hypothetical protein
MAIMPGTISWERSDHGYNYQWAIYTKNLSALSRIVFVCDGCGARVLDRYVNTASAEHSPLITACAEVGNDCSRFI